MTCPRVILAVLLTAYVTGAVTVFEECRPEEKLGCLSYQILANDEQAATESFGIRE